MVYKCFSVQTNPKLQQPHQKLSHFSLISFFTIGIFSAQTSKTREQTFIISSSSNLWKQFSPSNLICTASFCSVFSKHLSHGSLELEASQASVSSIPSGIHHLGPSSSSVSGYILRITTAHQFSSKPSKQSTSIICLALLCFWKAFPCWTRCKLNPLKWLIMWREI